MGAKYFSDDIAAASSKLKDFSGNRIKFVCSFGGKILPRPSDGQLRYVGGDTRVVTVDRSITFRDFNKKMENVFETMDVIIKYQLPTLDLDILISVICDEDLVNMIEEYDRYDIPKESSVHPHPRLRAFLFPQKPAQPSAENQVSPKQRYVNAVNGLAPFLVKKKMSSLTLLKVPDYISDPESSGATEMESPSPLPVSPWMDDLPLISSPYSLYDQNMRKVPSEGAVMNSPSKNGIELQRVQSTPNLIRSCQTHIPPVSTYNIVPNRQVLMANNCHGRPPATIHRGGSGETIHRGGSGETAPELGSGSVQHASHAHAASNVKSMRHACINRTGSSLKYMTDQ